MRRFSWQVLLTGVIAFGGSVSAISAEQPPMQSPVASSPSSTAMPPGERASAAAGVKRPVPMAPPTLPTLADPQQPGDAVVPQVTMPLQRGERRPSFLKPGSASAVGGGVDDHNARCLATAAAPRVDCDVRPAGAAAKAKGL